MSDMHPEIITIRKDICSDCVLDCEVRGWIDHKAPCSSCPHKRWSAYGDCPEDTTGIDTPAEAAPPTLTPSPPTTPAQPASPLKRTLRAWKRMGLKLVSRQHRNARRAACAGCQYTRTDAHTKLLSCGAGCSCGAAAVCVFRSEAKCKLSKW